MLLVDWVVEGKVVVVVVVVVGGVEPKHGPSLANVTLEFTQWAFAKSHLLNTGTGYRRNAEIHCNVIRIVT